MRIKKFVGLILLILLFSVFLSGCLTDSGNEGPANNGSDDNQNDETKSLIATYYIEDFNEEKIANPEILNTLAKTVRNFDIVAMQGIDDPNETAMKKLVTALNDGTAEDGKSYKYEYKLSAPVGPAGEQEQYAFIYDVNNVYAASIPYTYAEPQGDVFKWEPYMLVFRLHGGTGNTLLINIHTDPNNTAEEIDELATVVEYAKTMYAGQINMSILGNIYADEPYYKNSTTDSPLKSDDFSWETTDSFVSTIDGKAYDKIIVTKARHLFLTGSKGVFNITKEYNLTPEQTEAISSHYPVFVESVRYVPPTQNGGASGSNNSSEPSAV